MTVVQYVDIGETIADVAITDKTSTTLTTSSSILLSVLIVASFLANILLVATILASYKLRNHLLYLLFAGLGVLNALDCILIMIVALLYVANGTWTFGERICRLNAWAQQFLLLAGLFTLTLMSMERALGVTANGRRLLTARYVLSLSALFTAVALSFAMPTVFSGFRVSPYPNRFLCSISNHAPIVYSILNIVAYSGCLFVIAICFGALVRFNSIDRSLPQRPQDYGAFIMESRALQEYMLQSRLVLYLCIAYVLVQGPYIVLGWFVQIRNSDELLANTDELDVAQDVDTLITWLKLFFPLVVTILIYCTCHDIGTKMLNLVWCRRADGIFVGGSAAAHGGGKRDGLGFTSGNNVLTLVQTANGIQVRAPDGRRALPVAAARPPPPVIGLLSSQIGLADAILTSDEASAITTSEERTQKVLHPKVVHAPPSGLDKPAVGGRTSRIPRSHVPTPKQPSRARPLSRLRSGLSRLQRRQSSSHNRRPSAAPIA